MEQRNRAAVVVWMIKCNVFFPVKLLQILFWRKVYEYEGADLLVEYHIN